MNLPHSKQLPVQNLAAVFGYVTNSYKYYWLLAILEFVKKGNDKIYIHDLAIEMIGEVWYPFNYYRLSFGKQDGFENTLNEILIIFDCQKDIKKPELIEMLSKNRENIKIKKLASKLTRYVPSRFLTPWFNSKLRGLPDTKKDKLIIELSKSENNADNIPLYHIDFKHQLLIIHPLWMSYLQKHLSIIQGYTYWQLINYLQKLNPNVPNITAKIFPPEKRSLSKAKKFWDIYFSIKKPFQCIYSGNSLFIKNYSIDHYLPWSYVVHDQLWNLVPTLNIINSSKSDCLPASKYLDKFAELQYDAFHTINSKHTSGSILIEDYTVFFNNNLDGLLSMPKNEFIKNLKDRILPQMQIAKNMGFEDEWKFKEKLVGKYK